MSNSLPAVISGLRSALTWRYYLTGLGRRRHAGPAAERHFRAGAATEDSTLQDTFG